MFEVIRVEKTKDYTVISNCHLRDKRLSLKAKGLMTIMLSLPDGWDLSIKGLASIIMEGESTVRSVLEELEANGYFNRKRIYENGKIARWEYTLTEKPSDLDADFLHQENLHVENLHVENLTQLNTKDNKVLKKSNTIPPSVEDVRAYCKERNNKVDAETFCDFYESKGWKVGASKMKDWKAAVRTWEKRSSGKSTETKFNGFEQRNYDYNKLEQALRQKG